MSRFNVDPLINEPPLPNGPCARAPHVKALKRRGLIIHNPKPQTRSTLGFLGYLGFSVRAPQFSGFDV